MTKQMDLYNHNWIHLIDDSEVALYLMPNGNIMIADGYYFQYEEVKTEELIAKFENKQLVEYGDFTPKLTLHWARDDFYNKSLVREALLKLKQSQKFMESLHD